MKRLLFSLWVLMACHSHALADGENTVQIIEKKNGDIIQLWADSACNMDFTITLTGDLQNMTSSPALPATIESAGRQKFLLAMFRPSGAPWRWSYHYHWKRGGCGTGQTANPTFLLPYRGEHKVIQGFLGKFSHYQGSQNEYAVDFEMPEGTSVCAARGGTVVGLRQNSNSGGADVSFKGQENYVIIRHDDGTYAEYEHMRQNGALVKLGQKVAAQDPISLSGNTGHSSRPHLHFSVFNTIDGNTRATIPIRFQTKTGVVIPTEGESY